MPAELPEGDGIAAEYPGDLGIEEDPAVVFADGFETVKGDMFTAGDRDGQASEWNNEWDRAWHTMRIAQDPANVHSGRHAVEITLDQPLSYGAEKHFGEGFGTLHVRYYMKYHKEFPGCHHTGMCIMGGAPGVHVGEATGVHPDGENHFLVGLDTVRPRRRSGIPPPGKMNIYCYHMDQARKWGDLFMPSGEVFPSENAGLFGEGFVARPDRIADRDRWYCYELMVKVNTPGQRDGRVAFWVDGELAGDFPNLRLRSVEALKANQVVLSSYSSRRGPNKTLWYDDVVVATSYIGPQRSAAPQWGRSVTVRFLRHLAVESEAVCGYWDGPCQAGPPPTQPARDLLGRIPLPAYPENLVPSKNGGPTPTRDLNSFSGRGPVRGAPVRAAEAALAPDGGGSTMACPRGRREDSPGTRRQLASAA